MYAYENSGKFPTITGGGWPWDMPAKIANQIVQNGGKRDILYDPAFSKQDNDELWSFTTVGVKGAELAAETDPGFRVLGYVIPFKGAARLLATNTIESVNAASIKMQDGSYVSIPASERIMGADANISTGHDEKDRTKNTYTGVLGGWTDKKGHQSPHLDGRIPGGGNLLYVDSHVSWVALRNPLKKRLDKCLDIWASSGVELEKLHDAAHLVLKTRIAFPEALEARRFMALAMDVSSQTRDEDQGFSEGKFFFFDFAEPAYCRRPTRRASHIPRD